MLTVDMQEGTSSDVCLTGTAIDVSQVAGIDVDSRLAARIAFITATVDVTANDNLGLRSNGKEEKAYPQPLPKGGEEDPPPSPPCDGGEYMRLLACNLFYERL